MPFQPFLFTHSLLNLSATTMYLQHFMLIFQTESGFSKKRCSDVQDWGQVCSFQGKNCGGFGAFTTHHESGRHETHGLRNEMHFCAEESSQARSILQLFAD